jgi:hypothetical protein
VGASPPPAAIVDPSVGAAVPAIFTVAGLTFRRDADGRFTALSVSSVTDNRSGDVTAIDYQVHKAFVRPNR